jgi:hypothetical protein
MRYGDRSFAFIPTIIQETDTDGPTTPFTERLRNTISLGKVILKAACVRPCGCVQGNVPFFFSFLCHNCKLLCLKMKLRYELGAFAKRVINAF